MDADLTKWLNGATGSSVALDQFMIFVTTFGIPLMVLAVAAQWWRGTDRAALRHVLVSAGFAFLLGEGINQIILLFIHRERPYASGLTHLLIEKSSDWSFPSDHATAAAAIAAIFILSRSIGNAVIFSACAILVCISRVYVGTHYVSDIFGGAVTGILAALIVRKLFSQSSKLSRLLVNFL